MKMDMHCHVVGNGRDLTRVDKDIYFNPQDNPHWFTRVLYNLVDFFKDNLIESSQRLQDSFHQMGCKG